MRSTALFLLAASVAFGQTQSKPATSVAKPMSAASSGTTTKSASATAAAVKKPLGDIPLAHGIVKPLFTERYEDIKVGAGPLATPNKVYHVLYAGYLASTGQKFDSSNDHRNPVMKDGKAVLDADGKPQMGDPPPMVFPQGVGRLIPGFDQAFDGMHIGGKRRIFIPWQLAYGMHEIPANSGHVGIPAKSDLVFDLELVDVTDMPTQAPPLGSGVPRPVPPPMPNGRPMTPTAPPTGSAPSAPPAGAPPAASQAPSTAAPTPPPPTK